MGACCSKCCPCLGKRKQEEHKEAKKQLSKKNSNCKFVKLKFNEPDNYGGYERTSIASDQSVLTAMKDFPRFVAIHDYSSGSKVELLKIGDNLRHAGEAEDKDWIFVMRDTTGGNRRPSGYVPRSYVGCAGTVEVEPFYFGSLNGREAETYLRGQSEGWFLVRRRPECDQIEADAKKGDQKKECAAYALSVNYKGRVSHIPIFLIESVSGGYFLAKKRRFSSLRDMVQYYQAPGHASPDEVPCRLLDTPKRPKPTRVPLSLEAQKTWHGIPRSQIVQGERVGGGHFGNVYKGKWKMASGAEFIVAIKELKKSTTRGERRFLQEAITMKNLMHKHLVKLYGVVSADEPYWIITEFVRDGSLHDYLTKRKTMNQLLPERTLINVCAQIADGMRYLEEKHVVHKDLAARNVLVIAEGKVADPVLLVKIADFGLAELTDPTKSGKHARVPTKWTAPEALKDSAYSLLLNSHVREYVVERRYILPRDQKVPEKVYEIMKKCFRYDPKERPHFAELYQFFDSYYRKPGENSVTERLTIAASMLKPK